MGVSTRWPVTFARGSSHRPLDGRGAPASGSVGCGVHAVPIRTVPSVRPNERKKANCVWRHDTRTVWVITKWKCKLGIRMAYASVRDTAMGKLWVALLIVGLPSLLDLITEDHFRTVAINFSELTGLLLLAYLGLVASLITLVPPLLAKVFVIKGGDDPLAAHPAAMPALALYRLLVSTVLSGALYLLAFHYIFFGHAFTSRLTNPVLGWSIYLPTSLAFLVVIGVLTGAVCRALVRLPRMRTHAELVFRIGGALFVILFVVSHAGLKVAATNAPEWLSTIGDVGARASYFFVIPFGAALSADEGNWLEFMGWLAALVMVVSVVLRRTWGWSRASKPELLEPQTGVKRRYRSIFDGLRRGIPYWREVTPFVRKDVVAPYVREPLRYLSEQWFVASAEIGAVVLAAVARARGSLDLVYDNALLVMVLLLSVAVLAMLRGLSSLGQEGAHLALLRPVVTSGELFIRKGIANGMYVVVHGALHAVLIYVAAQIAGFQVLNLIPFLTVGVIGAAVLTIAASTLGFLLPDFERRAAFLPGASATAKYLYAGLAGLVAATVGASYQQHAQNQIDAVTHAWLLSFMAVGLSLTCGVIAWWATRRLRQREF